MMPAFFILRIPPKCQLSVEELWAILFISCIYGIYCQLLQVTLNVSRMDLKDILLDNDVRRLYALL